MIFQLSLESPKDPKIPQKNSKKKGWLRRNSSTLVNFGFPVGFKRVLMSCSIAEPLTEQEIEEKEELISQGFEDWSRRDFQQFVRALENYGWTDDFELLASEIQDKTAAEVEEYYVVFKTKWKELAGAIF